MLTSSLASRLGVALTFLLATMWALFRSGLAMTPVPDDLLAAARIWPKTTELWMTQFYADSPTYILFVRLFQIDDPVGLVRISFVASMIAVIALAAFAWHSTPKGSQARSARLVILAPVTAVLFSAIGNYDAFTALSWALILWAWWLHSRLALAISGVVLGLQHFEQGLLGVAALTITWTVLRSLLPYPLQHTNPIWTLPGLIAGKLALVAVITLNNGSSSGRTEWLSQFLSDWSKVTIVTFPYLVWALFAGLWLLVIVLWLSEPTRGRLALLAALVLGLIGTFLSGDRPRVFVLIILPSLLVAIIAFCHRSELTQRYGRIVEAMAWIGPPIILAGKTAVNVNTFDNAFVTLMWLTGLDAPA